MSGYGQVNFWWSPRPGETSKYTVRYWFPETREEAIDDMRRAVLAEGYTPPKVWQWWRWGEPRLPGNSDERR